jgi:integrase
MAQERQQEQQIAWDSLDLSGRAYIDYINAIKSQVTVYNYTFAIKKYMQYLKVSRISDLLLPLSEVKLVEANIISYLVYLKQQKTSFGTANCYLAAIKMFYDVHDYNLNRRKLARYLPDRKKASDDRGYTIQEIAMMLQGADDRLRALILLLASTGMRIGSIADTEKPLLQLKHLQKNTEYNLYKITVYEGFNEEYFCFTTPEAALAIDSYLKYRERYGEKLTPESALFREQFNTEDQFDCKNPRPVREKGLSKLIAERAIRCGVMTKMSLLEGQIVGKKRNKVFRTHGFRKFVTNAMKSSGVSALDINKLLGHKTKDGVLGMNYYKPEEEDLLGEYLKAVDSLTINAENRLKRENELLKVRKSEYEQLKEQVNQFRWFVDKINEKIGIE